MTTLQTIPDAASAEVPTNENFETMSAAGIFGKRHPVTSGLTWGYYGGLYNGNTKADGTVTLTDNADNYVVVLRSTGVVSVSTSSTNSLDPLYAKLYKVTTVSGAVTTVVDQRTDGNGLLLPPASSIPVLIQIAVSDETSNLTAGAAKITFRSPFAFTLTAVRGSVNVAATGGTLLTVDINEAGASVLSTKLTFDASEKTTTTAATPAVISDASIADDAEISIDIDAIGSTLPGVGLKVTLLGTR